MPDSIFMRNVPDTTEKFKMATVGVAGCGGLGSNAAVALVRAGVGSLILADFDFVEISNLNRQHFFLQDVGRLKVEALADHLRNINPVIQLDVTARKLVPADVPQLFKQADILIEAFDKAEEKQWLIETWCNAFPNRPIVIGSGLSGVGDTASLKIRKSGQMYICGDEKTDMSQGLSSARVGIVANMEANTALELLCSSSIS